MYMFSSISLVHQLYVRAQAVTVPVGVLYTGMYDVPISSSRRGAHTGSGAVVPLLYNQLWTAH